MSERPIVLAEGPVQVALFLPNSTSSVLEPNPDLRRKKSVSKRLNRSNFIYVYMYIHKIVHLDVYKTKQKNL